MKAAQRRRQSIEFDACRTFRRKADGESQEEYLRARDEAVLKALQG
jgi:hypothetical protein